MDGLTVQPQIRVEGEIRRASSDCCGAKIDRTPAGFACRACGQPCERVMSEPERMILHG